MLMSGRRAALFLLCGSQPSAWYSKPIKPQWIRFLPAMIKLLVEHGADINQTDQYGNTPLMWAVCCNEGDNGGGYAPAVRQLLSYEHQELHHTYSGLNTAQLARKCCSSNEIKAMLDALPTRP